MVVLKKFYRGSFLFFLTVFSVIQIHAGETVDASLRDGVVEQVGVSQAVVRGLTTAEYRALSEFEKRISCRTEPQPRARWSAG